MTAKNQERCATAIALAQAARIVPPGPDIYHFISLEHAATCPAATTPEGDPLEPTNCECLPRLNYTWCPILPEPERTQ